MATTFKSLLVDEIDASNQISLSASKVKVALPPLVLLIGDRNWISPASSPSDPLEPRDASSVAVLIVTDVPELKVFEITTA